MTLGELPWAWLGRVRYEVGVAAQERRRQALLAGDDSAAALILLEHEPVITLGRSARPENVLISEEELARRGVELSRASRGGDVTYHGPGQLMVYPVVRLRRGVVAYLEALAGGLAEVAAALGVPGAGWRRDPAGLWLGAAKLAACGLHVRRGVAAHGFALNVATPPEAWQLLVPCGLAGAAQTSIAAERARRDLPPPPAMEEVARLAAPILCRALGHEPLETRSA